MFTVLFFQNLITAMACSLVFQTASLTNFKKFKIPVSDSCLEVKKFASGTEYPLTSSLEASSFPSNSQKNRIQDSSDRIQVS